MTVYYIDNKNDDFGREIKRTNGFVVYDAKTKHGPWATMTEASFKEHGIGLGTGRGQKYVYNNGQFVKEAG